MILLSAIAIGVITAAGAVLLVRRDVAKVVAGAALLSNAGVLLLVSAGLGENEEPFAPFADPHAVSDPVVQALAITALVVGLGVTALLLRLALAVARSQQTVDVEDLVRAERREEKRLEPDEEQP